jgi:hypothetical protein
MPGERNSATSGDQGSSGPWLWVDPRREAGYNPESYDPAGFLERAVRLFQTKPHWEGRQPNAICANPAQVDNGLKPVAAELGLRLVIDPKVAVGTFWLGVVSRQKDGAE